MSGYKLRGKIKVFLSYLVPNSIRAVIYLDSITSVTDSKFMRKMEYKEKGNKHLVSAISGWDLETLRREAIKDINGGELPKKEKSE